MNYGKLTEDSGLLVSDALNSNADIICDIGVCGNDDFSQHLLTCWNEYDTLKARSELLDEATTLLSDILGWNGILDHSKVRISRTVDKAKELK